MRYPVTLTEDKEAGGYTVTFPDVPEAITQGDSLQEALGNASEALEVALSCYIDRRIDIPKPSRPRSKKTIVVGIPALCEAKIGLYLTMRDQGVRKSELARRLRWQKS
jgi:antitoxin HicB